MGSEWRKTTLGNIASRDGHGLVDGPFGSNLPASCYTRSGVPVIRGSNLSKGATRFRADEFVFVSPETAERLNRSLCRANDIIFTKKGTLGQTALIPSGLKFDVFLLSSNQMKLTVDQTKADPLLVYYYMTSPASVGRIIRDSESTGVPKTNVAYLREFPILLPPLPSQHRIAHILGTLDDKIELNRRMNRTLEAMAAAIFKSWFIDFDPVHAKAAGRDPLPASAGQAGGLPKEIADLFPDSFQDSELGPIPEGWELGTLGDVAENPRRSIKPDEVPPATPYIGLQDMPRRCIALDTWGRADEVGSQKSRFNTGDILFGKLRPYFHKVGIAPVDGVCSTDILVIVPKSEQWRSYVLSLVSSKEFVDYTDSHSAGTKMPRTNWKDMNRYPLAIPPVELAQAFQDCVADFHNRILLSIHQNRHLAALRDTLLPKLLSGEIDESLLEQVEVP